MVPKPLHRWSVQTIGGKAMAVVEEDRVLFPVHGVRRWCSLNVLPEIVHVSFQHCCDIGRDLPIGMICFFCYVEGLSNCHLAPP